MAIIASLAAFPPERVAVRVGSLDISYGRLVADDIQIDRIGQLLAPRQHGLLLGGEQFALGVEHFEIARHTI